MHLIKSVLATIITIIIILVIIGLVAFSWVVLVPLGLLFLFISVVFYGFKEHYKKRDEGP
tara:strand:- start:47875 stop:48054 length:180 start_codon:yes stop_codon:yes gene_type:complete